jgi:hypothetical protein
MSPTLVEHLDMTVPENHEWPDDLDSKWCLEFLLETSISLTSKIQQTLTLALAFA